MSSLPWKKVCDIRAPRFRYGIVMNGLPEAAHKTEQLCLPLRHDAHSLRSHFERMTGGLVSLTFTDNSVIMVSIKKKGEYLFLRLHKSFLDAGTEVLEEIGAFIRDRSRKTPHLRKFIKENIACLPKKRPRKEEIRTMGRHHNLDEIYYAVNTQYFGGRISCLITWGTSNPEHSVRKRTLGSYSRDTDTIRINPFLDRKSVPRYFLEFVVYHEMLHSDTEVVEKNGRRLVHTREFEQRERLFRHYKGAVAWEKGKLQRA